MPAQKKRNRLDRHPTLTRSQITQTFHSHKLPCYSRIYSYSSHNKASLLLSFWISAVIFRVIDLLGTLNKVLDVKEVKFI